MLISASRRTDIPAFYTPWLLNRLRAGWCAVANPFNARQVSRVSLAPEDVDALVFWTRDAAPLLPHLPELDARGYRYYFLYTITGYGRALEPRCPPWQAATETLRRVADHVGPARTIWRYDPMLFSPRTPPAWHIAQFAMLAEALAGATRRVKTSLVIPYQYAARRLAALPGYMPVDMPEEEIGACLRALADTAAAHGMTLESCACDLTRHGIAAGKCLDDAYLRETFGLTMRAGKDSGQRPACGCVPSRDIGAYDTCLHGCAYCYATHQAGQAERRYRGHDAESAGITGAELSKIP
jgi:hypothetical protein